jgi:hypothetical protein
MKKLFVLLLSPLALFSFEYIPNNEAFDNCSCQEGYYFGNRYESNPSFSTIHSDTTYNSQCYINSSRSRMGEATLHNDLGYATQYYVSRVTEYCIVQPTCSEGEFFDTESGSCVPESEGYECKEGYTEQLRVGINAIPAPCSDYDPTLYSDAYTAVYETDTTHQVCCVKPLPEPESENPDTNATPIDLNPTNDILEDIKDNASTASNTNHEDLEEIKNLETQTQARLDEVNEILAGINSDIKDDTTSQNSNNDANTDRQIANDNTLANQAHQDQLVNQGKYDDIILNLREVRDATNTMTANANANAEQAHEDSLNSDAQNQENADRNHNDLTDIKDALTNGQEDADNGLNGLEDNLNQMTDSLASGKDSILGSFNALLSSYTDTPPAFTGSGSHTFNANVLGGSVVFNLSLFSDLKPYFDILFTLMLAWINFKIYRWVIVILLKIGV